MFSKKIPKQIIRQPKIYSPPKEKEERKIPKIIKVLIFLVILVIALIYILLLSPLLQIKKIEIVGNLPSDNQDYLNQFKGQNLFFVKSGKISSTLQNKFPEFLNIEVLKGIPNILKVQIEEREVKIIWQSQSRYFFVDADGLAYKETNSDSIANLVQVVDNKNIEVIPPQQIATTNFTASILNLNAEIKTAGFEIKQFEVNDTIFQVSALTSAGFKIIFDTTRSLSDQVEAFSQVYRDHKDEIKEYVDIRVEGKVYYK